MKHTIVCGDAIEEQKKLLDNSIDACVTDPPYELNFMNKGWDRSGIAFNTEMWQELYRVLKPGAHILVAGIARTHHRMWVALEDAGFEIRDGIYHVFGSGFPKSLDISKSIDKMNGKEREVIGIKKDDQPANTHTFGGFPEQDIGNNRRDTKITTPSSKEAIQWNGWGTALKPAVEIWCLARKPISERNIASNVLRWGVGGLNVNGCRILMSNEDKEGSYRQASEKQRDGFLKTQKPEYKPQGRFPANLILECCCEEDELVEGEVTGNGHFPKRRTGESLFNLGDEKEQSESYLKEKCGIHTNPNCVCRMLDEQTRDTRAGRPASSGNQGVSKGMCFPNWEQNRQPISSYDFDRVSGASRFFYQAKASQNERWFYCTICKQAYSMKERDNHIHNAPEETKHQYLEFHPTQKPLQLIQYLTRLITPPNGTVLDLFMGTGTTLVAAEQEGFNSIGIDSKLYYCKTAENRLREEMTQQKITGERSILEKTGF